jgi:hypothetical protein
MPLGTHVTVHGWLTTPLGLTETGRGAFMQDETGGIALYLASGPWPSPAAIGTELSVSGVLETRFSLLTLRVAGPDRAELGQVSAAPAAVGAFVNEVGEALESRLVTVEGAVSDGISTLTDGFSTAVDDGTGTLRVVVATATGIDRAELPRGRQVRLTGVVGQRDTSGTGLGGYRLHLRGGFDVEPIAVPSPAPSASPGPLPSGSPQPPSPLPSPTLGPPAPSPAPATPSPLPTATPPNPIPVAAARQLAAGQRVVVQGVVTVRPGRVLGDRTACLQDASAGICVRLPDGVTAVAGDVLLVDGPLADPYGNLEIRPAPSGVTKVGSAALPPARQLSMAELGEATEGLLALVKGTVTTSSASSTGAITVMLEDASGEGRVYIHAPLGMTRDQFPRGRRLSVYGIVGDRLGLYRLWPRDPGDFVTDTSPGGPGPTPAPGGGPTAPAPTSPGGGGLPGPGPSAPASPIGIGEALRRVGQKVTVDGVVSVPGGLLDADGRRVTIQDGSGAILLRLPAGVTPPAVGQRLRASGEVGTYYGAPQLAAGEAPELLGGGTLEALRIRSAPLPVSAEWRLVVVSGTVESLSRSGDSWRAELAVDGGTIPTVGLGRSGIPADALVKGRMATVTGVVRRAYPTATDQRLAIVPRSRADISLGAEPGGSPGPVNPGEVPWPGASPSATSDRDPQTSPTPAAAAELTVALSELAAHEGQRVRIGGRVERFAGERVLVSDGSAVATLLLAGDARPLLLRLRPGLLVNATGLVVRLSEGGLAVRVDSPLDLAIGGRLQPAASSSPLPVPSAAAQSPLPDPVDEPAGATDGLAVVVALLMVVGAVTGSATAWLAAQPRHRRALQLLASRLREAIWRWRSRLLGWRRP